MIIEVEQGGSTSHNACSAQIHIGRTVFHEQTRIRLLDVTVPDPPLLDAFPDGFVTDIDSFDVPVVRSMLELIDFLDTLHDSVSNAKLLEVVWDGVSLEVLALSKTVNCSALVQAILKLPAVLPVNQIKFSTLNLKGIDVSDGYVVTLDFGETEGFFKGDETHVVASFPRGASRPANDYFFATREPASSGTVAIFSRRRDSGALRHLYVGDEERWSARIEIDRPRRGVARRRF